MHLTISADPGAVLLCILVFTAYCLGIAFAMFWLYFKCKFAYQVQYQEYLDTISDLGECDGLQEEVKGTEA